MLWTSSLQVVILAAGRGSRMTELIGTSVPKCLIPFGGNPLLFYPLKSLAMNGFSGKDILVIIQDKDDIRKQVLKLGEKAGLSSVETFSVPEDSEEFGTAESLRLAITKNKIKTSTENILIIACDLVGPLPISKLLDLHGLHDSSFSSLYMKPFPQPTTKLPGPKSKFVVERDIVGVVEESNELVFMASEADLDEKLILPANILKKFPNFNLLTWLSDCHLYIVRKKLLEKWLFEKGEDEDEKYLSLKGEFFPWLVQSRPDNINCFTLIEPEKCCIRINSIHNYMVVSQSNDWLRSIFANSINRAQETKISKGCKLVGTTLGDHGTVGDKCKLTNVITLDHVKIEAGCELQNVILSSNAQIGANAVLNDVLVGPKYQVPSGSRHTNEHLTVIEETFFEP